MISFPLPSGDPSPDREPRGRRLTVGIGELAVSDRPDDVIVTHALGSCIAVCLFDPVASVAAMLHFLLPDSRINPERALAQPAAFADTGIPLLFQTAYRAGLDKRRAVVKLAGGAETAEGNGAFMTGRRNALAAKNLLWRNGVLIQAQNIGGTTARTVHLSVRDGRVQVFNSFELTEL
ncbi:MAG TPA: chemotaxis protein CheD [Vicinamibacterales bacterium]|nr:chemotaxis protein CheD [Vicinamibacterales bacterium]